MKMLRYSLIFFIFSIQGCSWGRQKKLDTRISLWRLDRIPYGTKYAYDNLPAVFPYADIRTTSLFPMQYQPETKIDTTRALIILTPAFYPAPDEMNSLIRFAASGNQVFISSRYFDDTIMDMLHLKVHQSEWKRTSNKTADSSIHPVRSVKTERRTESGIDTVSLAEIEILNPDSKEWKKFAYPGDFSANYFDEMDTGHARILGRNQQGKADFVRIAFAHGGALFVHLDPQAFSNFFLLHQDNKSYYDLALSWMPLKTGVVIWSDYFRYSRVEGNFSALHFLLSNQSLRWAFWLTLLLFLLIFLVESKRKQRPIAEIPRLRNASEDFVKTVSRLYFQQKNNQNLAAKMTAAFLENIRSAYNLSTNVLDDEFAHKLAYRTGRPIHEIAELIQSIHDSRLKVNLTDREIMDLHQKFNQFNKPVS